MTGFARRFLRWWMTRRDIGERLARDVSSYLDEHLTKAEEDVVPAAAAEAPRTAPAHLDRPSVVSGQEADETRCFSVPAPAAGTMSPMGQASPSSPHMASKASPSLDQLLRNLDAPFSETLLQMIDVRGLTDAQVYRRARMSRQHFSKIRSNPAYRPTKPTVLSLAIALELTLDETRLLLERAGFSLSHASKADVIVEYFLGRREYDLDLINRTLYHFDQPILGS